MSEQGIKKIAGIAINAFETGNEDKFLENAKMLYNAFANISGGLDKVENPYLLGVVYSLFADYYSHDINIYTSILENSIYCFSKIIIESDSESDRQGASIRLFILFNDNERIVRHIIYKFNKNTFKDSHEITLQLLVDSDFENRKEYLVYIAKEGDKKAFLSEQYMRKFDQLSKNIKKSPFTVEGLKSGFENFYKNISEIIRTPYDRRITVLF